MVKKISFLILSVAILVIGIIAFSKISYWDRSVRIFSFSQDATQFEGRMGRGPEGREGFARPEMRQLPDSIHFRPRDGERMERGPLGGGIRNGEGRGRGEFPGGKKINIRNVKWFLAVFAAFTVIAIYFDKVVCLIRKRKGKLKVIQENI